MNGFYVFHFSDWIADSSEKKKISVKMLILSLLSALFFKVILQNRLLKQYWDTIFVNF